MAEKVFTNCLISGPISAYVKDGHIARIRPPQIDEKDFKPWTIEAQGKSTLHLKRVKSTATYYLQDLRSILKTDFSAR